MKSKRFEVLAARPVNQDGYVQEWPEVGLIAMNSPFDPKPSIKIEHGVVIEMDGKCRADFDMLDTFIADHAIRLGNAEKAMAMDSLEIARKIVDINVSREEILDITLSLTPAKLTEVVGKLNIVEIMMGMTKMRARMMPANQCHVTNMRDNPVQIAADAAEAGVRGFAEMETTVAVARYAPFNAMALFVGAQVGRPGVMTQCALEEATELQLGMRGFTTYAETISVYGTEPVFMDGDLLSVALREAREETGVEHIRPLSPAIASLDILPVWGHVKRGKWVPSHQHLNVSYLLVADESDALQIREGENSRVGWLPAERLLEYTNEWQMDGVYAKLLARARELLRNA